MSAELEALAGEAAAADIAGGGGAGDPPAKQASAAPAPTPAQEWAQVPAIFGQIVGRWFPEVNAIYTAEANQRWGDAMVPVAQRYGWSVDKLFAWLGPVVPLIMATEALVTPTAMALHARIKKAREERAKQLAERKPADTPAP